MNSPTHSAELQEPTPPRDGDSAPQGHSPALELPILEQQRKDREQAQRQEREQIRQARAAELERRLGASLIPKRFLEYSFASFPVPQIADPLDRERASQARIRCERYAERWEAIASRGTNLLLVGPMGSGKTGLACSIGNHLIKHYGATVLFMTAYAAVRHMRDTWKRKDKTETQALQDLVQADLLILDDVGAQLGSDSEMLMLFEALNGRYAERRPTVILSNLQIEDEEQADGRVQPGLASFLGPRIWDRLTDDQSAVIACSWPSLRGGRPS